MSEDFINMNGVVYAMNAVNKQHREEAVIENGLKEKYPNLLTDFLSLPRAEKVRIAAAIKEITGWEFYGVNARKEDRLFNSIGNCGTNYRREWTILVAAWKKANPDKF